MALPIWSGAQVVETTVRNCAIESVVVYSDRAEVKRRVPINLEQGKNEVLICGFSTWTDRNSIRLDICYVLEFLTTLCYVCASNELQFKCRVLVHTF